MKINWKSPRLLSLSFVTLLVLAIHGMIAPVSASRPALSPQADSFTVLYTDHEEVHLSILVSDYVYQSRRVELYRGATLLQRYAVGPYATGEWTYYDTGLVRDTTYTYQLKVYPSGGTPTVYTATASTVLVRGTLTRNRTWAGGVWQGAELALKSGATLSIISGARVMSTTIESRLGSLIVVDGASLKHVSVRTPYNSYTEGGTASVKNSTLEDTSIGVRTLAAFESNAGVCPPNIGYLLNAQRLSSSPQFNLSGNHMPNCRVVIERVTGQQLNMQDNTVKEISLGGLDWGDGSIIVTSNTITHELYIHNFTGTVNIEGNRLSHVQLQDVDGEGPKTIRANDFPYAYSGGNISVYRTSPTRVEGNTLIECGTSHGIAVSGGSYNEVVGNTWVCNSGTGIVGVHISGADVSSGNVLVQDNTILSGQEGIYDVSSTAGTLVNTRFEHNTVTCVPRPGQNSCTGSGIRIPHRPGNQILGNTVTGFFTGLALGGTQATVRDNQLISNTQNIGTSSGQLENSLIYNNACVKGVGTNARQVNMIQTVALSNTWNIPKTAGSNIVGGLYQGGNYWSDYTGVDADGDGLGDTLYTPQYFTVPIDPLPLIAHPLPDLSVRYFVLDPTRVTFDSVSRRYRLPVDVTVANLGLADAASIAVRLSDNASWSETRNIASLKVGASADLHLDWDITPILLAGQGRNTLQLTAQADPANAIQELDETNNTRSHSTLVDARPRVTEIRPDFALASAYFLDNESVPNPIRALVDWNGDLVGNGGPPYGKVRFDLNDVSVEKDGQDWGAQHTYDMGADFRSSYACANNTLRITAAYPVQGGEFVSLESALQPTVFPFPMWVNWAIQNLPGSDASFDTALKAPLVEYTYDFKYPSPPFEATWTPPSWVPYLGGQELGIADTQAAANALGRSDGSGKARVEGQTALNLAALNVIGNLWGQGETQFKCGESLDLTRAQLAFNIKLPIEKEASLVDVVPAAKAATEWPVIGRIIKWVLGVAQVKAALTPEVNIETLFEEQVGTLEFVNGTGTGKIDAKVALAIQPCEDLNAEVYGGGTPYVTLQVPKNPGYLKEVGIDLYYGATFEAWEFETSYERKVNCHYPGGCSEVEPEAGALMAADLLEPTWHLIPRNHAPSPSSRLTGNRSGMEAGTTETVLLSNIYPRLEPALALRSDGRRLLAYINDDVAKPHGRGTEVNVFTYSGSAWSSPSALTNDQQPDFNPALTFDTSGDGLLVWERSTLPAGITPTLDITFAQSLEIAARAWNGTSWASLVTLTNNSLMDHAPCHRRRQRWQGVSTVADQRRHGHTRHCRTSHHTDLRCVERQRLAHTDGGDHRLARCGQRRCGCLLVYPGRAGLCARYGQPDDHHGRHRTVVQHL